MEELVKFTLLTRDCAGYLVDRYSERRESVEALSKRVNLRSLRAVWQHLAGGSAGAVMALHAKKKPTSAFA